MTSLAVLEDAIVALLADVTYMGDPLFRTLRAMTGPLSAALLGAIRRDITPAVYVVFLSERLDPAAEPADLGPRFTLLLADRALRQGFNPRHGDPPAPGVYETIRQVRDKLDNADLDDYTLRPVAQNALASDDRFAIFQMTYRAEPKA